MDHPIQLLGIALPSTAKIHRAKTMFVGICGIFVGVVLMVSSLDEMVLDLDRRIIGLDHAGLEHAPEYRLGDRFVQAGGIGPAARRDAGRSLRARRLSRPV
jgi:hypothetical protein